MRRQVRGALPALAASFGLMPWELDRLTGGELDVFLAALHPGGGDLP